MHLHYGDVDVVLTLFNSLHSLHYFGGEVHQISFRRILGPALFSSMGDPRLVIGSRTPKRTTGMGRA